MKILLTLAAGIAVVAVASFAGSAAGGPGQNHAHAFGVTTQSPGCAEDVPPPGPPFCLPFDYTFRVLAVEYGDGHAWGLVSRLNHDNGVVRDAEVTCMTVADGKAAIGGFETTPTTYPFLLYVQDRGGPGGSATDRISPYAVYPPGDPDLPRLPADFPRTCPSPDSLYGYFPQASGDITVADD